MMPLIRSLPVIADEIRQRRNAASFQVHTKLDGSPVTNVDLWAHKALLGLLQDPQVCSPWHDACVVSEESDDLADPGLVEAVRGNGAWIVDPIDGTRDFVMGLDSYVICLAWVNRNGPQWGCVVHPVRRQVAWANRGEGAWLCDFDLLGSGQETRLLRSPWQSGEPVVAGTSRTAPSERLRRAHKRLGVTRIEAMGSAWKFVALAKGEIDLFPRFGPSHEWDTAAGQIIIEEAGASLLALDTLQPLAYGKPDWFNSAGFVAGAPELLTDERLKSLVDLRGETEGKA